MRSRFTYGMVVFAALCMMGAAPAPKGSPAGWCCLCMCHSVDESKCAPVCVKMQHGKKIIEEPEMKSCTKTCLQHGVEQIPSNLIPRE